MAYSTMNGANIYPTTGSRVNNTPSVTPTGRKDSPGPGGKTDRDWNGPGLPTAPFGIGLSIPALFAVGFMAWWLFRQY